MYKMLLQNSTDSTKHNHLCRSRIPNHVKSEPTVLGRIAAACGIPTAPNTPYGSLPCGPQTPQRIRPGCPGAPGKSSNPADALNLEISTHQGVPVNVTASTINESFVLFGVQGCRRTLELAQINISPNTDDDVFFRNLKASYRKHRGFWRYWLSIWQMRYCDFVKVCYVVFSNIGHTNEERFSSRRLTQIV